GNPENYSFFEAVYKIGKLTFIYEIRHNINIQSYYTDNTYTTPDISILKPDQVQIDNDFYISKQKYYYVSNSSLISFCEVKNFTPYPELLFNFIGVVNELRPNLLRKVKYSGTKHITTSLMISGKSNRHTDKIIANLQDRYHINVICDLFNIGGITFGRHSHSRLKTV